MKVFNSRVVVFGILLAASLVVSACRRTYVIVPRPTAGYTPMDTLRGRSDGRNVRVTFHFDTTWRVDTVTRLDTAWRDGTRLIVRVDTLRLGGTDTVYRGTPRIIRDTLRLVVRDTIRLGARDTVRLIVRDTIRLAGRDTVRLTVRDTIRLTVRDTIRLTVRDTIRLVVSDTVFRVDTVRVAGRRTLFVPPGHYPPPGECRVWIHDRPPGQQARAGPCNALGTIPPGAFILFGGDAWDAEYDWVAESQRGAVPPEIVALSRRRGARP